MKTTSLDTLLENYSSYKNNHLFGRYITYKHIAPELEKLRKDVLVEELGQSVLKEPIQAVTIGNGPVKVLAWSQMHGNESTTTKAVFDLFNLLKSGSPHADEILRSCTIKVIPMLNPDGAVRYTRENVNSVDLNRDAQDLEEEESRVLRACFDAFKPEVCLNLHDQRTIFSAGDTTKPATLSFLAPAMDQDRTINEVREKAMKLIAAINQDLQHHIPGQVGRYDDAFNPNCTGDTFQALVPTILFEAGHYPGDYEREETRKFVWGALYSVLSAIALDGYKTFETQSYFKIPENKKKLVDVLLKHAGIGGKVLDVALQFEEKVKAGKVVFDPVVQVMDPSLPFSGHREVNCEGQDVKKISGEELNENDVVDTIMLKGKKLLLKRE